MTLLPEFEALIRQMTMMINPSQNEKLSWQDLMTLRVKANQQLADEVNSKLSHWEEKNSMKSKFEQCQVPTSKVVYTAATLSDWNRDEFLQKISQNSGSQVVAKATHLTTGNCVFVLHPDDGSVHVPCPVGPGKQVMEENHCENFTTGMTFPSVAAHLEDSLTRNAGERECKALRECQRGILCELYFGHDVEVRVASVFGQVVVAATDCNLRISRSGQIFEVDRHELKPTVEEQQQWVPLIWPQLVDWTEKLAKGTDYLRVDYFVQKSTLKCVASEMNAFPWPESLFFDGFLSQLKHQYVNGFQATIQQY